MHRIKPKSETVSQKNNLLLQNSSTIFKVYYLMY